MAIAEQAVHPTAADFRPRSMGIAARVGVAVAILAGVLLVPLVTGEVWDRRISLAAIFAVIGLSVNAITGHAGQVSLGHQAFVGIGAFMSAFVASSLGAEPFAPSMPTSNFFLALTFSAVIGAVMALFLGVIGLRIRGLYLALITLAFGLMAETTVFNWEPFTGGGAGSTSPRPSVFVSEQAYAYLCLLVVGVFLLIDWRLVKTKAGRAIVALRNDERVAATLGINVTAYKLLAFVVAGIMAGVAGGLFAHHQGVVQAADFSLQTALVWVIMAVVGGLGSRAGVVIASSFFAIFPSLLPATSIRLPFFGDVIVQILAPFIGATLLILTLTLYPGGIGQQLLPFRRWLAGGPLVESRHEAMRMAGFPALVGLAAVVVVMRARVGMGMAFLVGVAGAVAGAVVGVFLFSLYLTRYHRTLRSHRPQPAAPPGAVAPVPQEISREVAVAAASDGPVDAPTTATTPLEEPTASGPAPPSEDGEPTRPIPPGRGARRTRTRRRRGS